MQVEQENKQFNITNGAVDVTFAALLHDAVLLYAHAATKVLAEGGSARNGVALRSVIEEIEFEGITSRLRLDRFGDRFESYSIMNYLQIGDGKPHFVEAGFYDFETRQYSENVHTIVWPGNSTEVPEAYTSTILCGLGEYKHGNVCIRCSGGRFSSSLTQGCAQCEPGHYSTAGASACTACNPGLFSNVAGMNKCLRLTL